VRVPARRHRRLSAAFARVAPKKFTTEVTEITEEKNPFLSFSVVSVVSVTSVVQQLS